jgi:hemolysin III
LVQREGRAIIATSSLMVRQREAHAMSSAAHATSDDCIPYSRAEVAADGVVHAVGLAGAVVAASVLLHDTAGGDVRGFVAALIYGAALVLMPLLSGAYNLSRRPEWRRRLRPVDQAAIFVMIAGTYTPFGLVALGGPLGHALLVLVWTVAGIGIVLKLTRPAWLEGTRSVLLYLGLGWCALPAIGPLVAALGPSALALLGIGGVLYTLGVIFHLWTTLPFHHVVWHGFVLAAATTHVFAVFAALDA